MQVTLELADSKASDDPLQSLAQHRSQLALADLTKSTRWLPQLKFLQLPFLFRDRQHLYQALDNEIGRQIFQADKQPEHIPLAVWDLGFRQLATSAPLLLPEQLLEINIATPQGNAGFNFKQANDAGEQATTSDLQYTVAFGYDMLLTELTEKPPQQINHLTLSNHILSGRILVVSRSFWDGLPEDLKVIVKGAVKDATLYFRELAQQQERQSLRKLKNGPLKVHRLTSAQRRDWQAEMQRIYPQLMGNADLQIVESILNLGSVK
jgi:C4-dicarboxylate-binding protein DctP